MVYKLSIIIFVFLAIISTNTVCSISVNTNNDVDTQEVKVEVITYEDWVEVYGEESIMLRRQLKVNQENIKNEEFMWEYTDFQIQTEQYKKTVQDIEQHNKLYDEGKTTYRKGVNQFSGLSPEEFKELISRPYKYQDKNIQPYDNDFIAPSSMDWRQQGAVTDIKNQGHCGSCWAFSSTGSLEGAYFIATGELRSLSEQQLLDCSKENLGCNGGNFDKAFAYILENGGIDSETDYPYQTKQLPCWSVASARHVANMNSTVDVPQNSEPSLIQAVTLGPVSIAIEADQSVVQSYKQGIISDSSCGIKLDHGVLAVGFTSEYWIVKNSWGQTWGESGYVRISRGSTPQGICGINMDPVQPYVGPKGTNPLPIPSPTPGPEPGPKLKCNCTSTCVNMCTKFGMICCGDGHNCDCSSVSSCPQCKPDDFFEFHLPKWAKVEDEEIVIQQE